MRPMTVRDLHEQLGRAVAQGMGDRLVAVSDDEECNGFHLLWEALMTHPDDIRAMMAITPMDVGDRTAEEIVLVA